MEVKTYTTIFDKAKAAYGTGAYDDATLEFLFPEIKLSEDERMLRALISGFENWKSNGNLTFNLTDVDDILAYLERQKEPRDCRKLYGEIANSDWFKENYVGKSLGEEQKPEWSEADEVYLEDALWCVDKAEKSCKDDEDKGACWSAKRWLKSIRPTHWKPSEEQMEALERASTNKYLSAKQYDILVSLYEQLNRL